ncbi:MAG TPA: TspO/MBR family protein [Tepidisphaeraceae bacterium]|jgi:tryptophan-rich sensory protein|nr:TspO/MBR family protein [Tepidisphaeraceae bacterium]
MKLRDWLLLLACIAGCELMGIASGVATMSSVREWYPTLNKPWFNPPAWLFGPVWTLLYAMMGVALFLVLRRGGSTPGVRGATIAFAIQLALNALWSPAFFGLRSPLAGLIVIVPLLGMIIVTIVLFFRLSRAAGALMVPYLLWASFATVLNAALYWLNR